MKDIGKVARKYTAKAKNDSNAREVSELALDIIQAWGEAFLPRSKQYPNFSKTYHELRKEGLPFKTQYDESRVPVFTPPPTIPDDLHFQTDPGFYDTPDTLMDAQLAAALALSMAEQHPERRGSEATRRSSSSAAPPPVSSTTTPFHQTPSRSRTDATPARAAPVPSRSSTADIINGCQSTMIILKEIVLASQSYMELKNNEIAEEVSAQLRVQQGALGTAIEREIGSDTGAVRLKIVLNLIFFE
jgi:hypothetical protein